MRGAVGDHEARSFFKGHHHGDGDDAVDVDYDLFGVRAVVEQRGDARAEWEVDAFTDFDDGAGGFHAWREGGGDLHLVGPFGDQRIGEVNPSGAHTDSDRAGPNLGTGDVFNGQVLIAS